MKQFLFILSFLSLLANVNAADYVITSVGASSDSTMLNTSAIQSAIDKASEEGGGTIVIPKGVYLSGALFFKPNTKLKLEEGAVLKGSDNIADYPLIPSRMEGQSIYYYAALVNAYRVDSFSISGPGMINGNGLNYWKYFWACRDSVALIKKTLTNLEVHRPRLLFIWNCNNVKISNVKLCNSGFWTTHLYQCTDVLIDGCDIRSPFKPVKAPSTDGIDIDVCKGVTVRNCYISVNDDAVCVKGGKGWNAHNLRENGIVEDILVENCTFGDSHGVLTLGSECIHAKNIILRNCKVDCDVPLLRLKMRPDTYQVYENITVENVTGSCRSIIEMKPWKQFFTLEGSNAKPFGIVRNITVSNINVKCGVVAELAGNPMDQVSKIQFNNVTATASEPTIKSNYKGIKLKNVIINGSPLVMKKENVKLKEHTFD
jgi:polygalacturonase